MQPIPSIFVQILQYSLETTPATEPIKHQFMDFDIDILYKILIARPETEVID